MDDIGGLGVCVCMYVGVGVCRDIMCRDGGESCGVGEGKKSGPAGRLFLETCFLLAGCIRLDVAVLLRYGWPSELH